MTENETLTTCSNNKEEIAKILNCKIEQVPDNLTVNSANVYASRYLLRDLDTGQIKETMDELWERIAKHIALVDVLFLFYQKDKEFTHNDTKDLEFYQSILKHNYHVLNPNLNESYLKHFYKVFERNKDHVNQSFDNIFQSIFISNPSSYLIDDYFKQRVSVYKELISSLRFLPNTPTIMNAGTDNGQLCACYVLDIEDDMHSIMKAVSDAVFVFKGAGGVGINFSKIRPSGDVVGTVPNAATGPMSFASMINFNANLIKQGGKRRGANMMLLNCVSGDTLISTLNGKIPIRDLVGQEPLLYCLNNNNELRIRKALKVIHNGKRNLLRIKFDDDSILECTADHKIMLSDGSFREAKDLKQFDSIMAFYKTTSNKRYHVSTTISKNWINEQILSVEYKIGKIIKQNGLNRKSDDLYTHHLDGNQLNNNPENLEIMTISEHSRIHTPNILIHQKRIALERKGKKLDEVYNIEKVKKWKQNMSKARNKKISWNKGLKGDDYLNHYKDGIKNQFSNHKVISIEYLEGEYDVYDIIMKDYHNFVANGVFVHNCNHPDIEEYITMKQVPGVMENYNISVAMNKDFWEDYDNNRDHKLINPRDGKVIKKINSHDLFNLIAESAWKSAEPGMVYFDNANKFNPLLPILGKLNSCNPCSEQIMYPNNSCTLGSIDLAKYVDDKGRFNYSLFKVDVYTATRFLDNIIDINDYPTPEIKGNSIKIRRIGLGYMGLAHALYKMGIQYNSEEGFEFIERISTLLTQYSAEASVIIAEERGAHYYWNDLIKENLSSDKIFNGYTENNLIVERWLRDRLIKDGMRNTWTTTIAPTGTISMAADTSSGVEPVYSLAMSKSTSIGKFHYKDKEFISYLKKEGLYSDELMEKIAKNHGSCKGLVPEYISNVFVTAIDIHWLDHLVALAKAQKGISNSISKTINLPRYATVDDLKLIYLLARYMGIKGVSVYRDGCREKQVLDTDISEKDFQKVNTIGQKALEKDAVIETRPSSASLEYVFELVKEMDKNTRTFVFETLKKNEIIYNQSLTSNVQEKCPLCSSSMVKDSHCTKCLSCEYGYCS